MCPPCHQGAGPPASVHTRTLSPSSSLVFLSLPSSLLPFLSYGNRPIVFLKVEMLFVKRNQALQSFKNKIK